jgi:alpha-tubulin suppressor-like RCC1 family protein
VAGETGDGDPVEGTGIRYNNKVPYPVAGGLTFSRISAGSSHTCGITTTGALYCWGSNAWGQVGDGGSRGGPEGPHWRNVPVAIASGTTFISVAAGSAYTCAVATGGTTYCWGNNDSQVASGGHFGAPGTIMTPRDAEIGVALAEVYGGGNRAACGRTSAGAVYCWGSDSWGMLGDGPTATPSGAGPKLVAGTYQQVSVGTVSACAIGTDQGLYCWGENHDGQVGFAASGDYQNDFAPGPVEIGAGIDWKQAAVGGGFACGLTTAGVAYCWGLNASGQVGIGSYTPRNATPTAVTGGLTFASLSPNSQSSSMCGVTTSGDTWCWGNNISWQLGTTTPTIDALAPVKVSPAN